jgi:hypothetical protein
MSTSRTALFTDGKEELGMGFGNAKVVLKKWDRGEYIIEELMTARTGLATGQFDAHPQFGNRDGRDCHVVIIVDHLVELASRALGIDEERGVEQEPCQLRTWTVTRSRTEVSWERHEGSGRCRRSIDFTSSPRPLTTGSI